MSRDRLLSLLGMAQKAGKVASGEFSTEKSVKEGRAYCVIVAGDASDNTKKMFTNMCSYYQVPIYFYGNRETIGKAIGKEFRASVAVNDEGFAKSFAKQFSSLEQ